MKQQVKIRLEFGPCTRREMIVFDERDALAAVAQGLLRLMTADIVIPGPDGAFVGSKGEFTAHVEMLKGQVGSLDSTASDPMVKVYFKEYTTEVTIERSVGEPTE